MKNQEPDYENEAEYKYQIIVLLIILFGYIIHSNYEKITYVLCQMYQSFY